MVQTHSYPKVSYKFIETDYQIIMQLLHNPRIEISEIGSPVHAQSDLETTKYRNMVIDLGNGLKTNARLNLPANGDGPFPGVLLVHGSGPVDMNETLGYVRIDKETGSKIYPPARPFFQIAEYLSERGLRYYSMTREVWVITAQFWIAMCGAM